MSVQSKHVVVASLLMTLCLPAFAYVDPVSGAMLLQIIVSGFTGLLLVFRRAVGNLFRRIVHKLTGKPDRIE